MSAVIARIDQAGRISISAQHRRALGLEGASPVVISVVGNELRIRSMHAAMAELQTEAGRFLQSEPASVDTLVAQQGSDIGGEEELAPVSSEPKPMPEPKPEPRPTPKPVPRSKR